MRLTVGEDTKTILSSSRPEEHAPAGVPGDLSGQQALLQRRQVGWACSRTDREGDAFGQPRPRSAVITREFRLSRAQVDAEAATAKPDRW